MHRIVRAVLVTIALTSARPALAGAPGPAVTLAPMVDPFYLPLPGGASVRLTLPIGDAFAVGFDVGATRHWILHTGWFLFVREQLVVDVYTSDRGRIGRWYMGPRLGAVQVPGGAPPVNNGHAAWVAGRRWDWDGGMVAQLGLGAWGLHRDDLYVYPVVELRVGAHGPY